MAHKGRLTTGELFLKLGLLLTKYRIGRAGLESEEVVIYGTVSTHAIIEFLLNRRQNRPLCIRVIKRDFLLLLLFFN